MKGILMGLLKEPSTYRGLVLILTALGVQIEPDQANAIVTAGLGFAGVLGAFLPDRMSK